MKELKIPVECPVCGMKVQIKKIEYECPKCDSKGQIALNPEGTVKNGSIFTTRTGDSFGARNCFPLLKEVMK